MVTVKQSTHSAGHEMIRFSVQEFEHYNRSPLWFIVSFVVFAGALSIAILVTEYLLAIIILISFIVFHQLALLSPKIVDVFLSERGLGYGNTFYPWAAFKSYMVSHHNTHTFIYLQPLAHLAHNVRIPLPARKQFSTNKRSEETEQDVFLKILRSVLPEQLHGRMTLSDRLQRVIRL